MRYAVALLWKISGWLASHVIERSAVIERRLGLVLSEADAAALAAACASCGRTIGHYYRWYLLKLLFARRWRRATARGLLRAVYSVTSRSSVAAVLEGSGLEDSRGAVIAIPHHGHYIAAVIAVVEALIANRTVCVMYGDPRTHPGNDIFDRICDVLWSGGRTRPVVRLRPDVAGLRAATKALRAGAALITFPDVHQDVRATYAFRFLGHRLDLKLGSAGLARSGNAALIPVLARVCEGTGWLLVDPLEPIYPHADSDSIRLVVDYAATRAMFSRFEQTMAGQILYWQYVRQIYGAPPQLPRVAANQMEKMLEALIEGNEASLGVSGGCRAY